MRGVLLHLQHACHHDDVCTRYDYDHYDSDYDNNRVCSCRLYYDHHRDTVLLRPVDEHWLRARRMRKHAAVPVPRMLAVRVRFAEQVPEFVVVHANHHDNYRRSGNDNNDGPCDDYDHGRANHDHYNAAGLPVQLHNGVGVLGVTRLVQERLFLQLGMLLLHRVGDHYNYCKNNYYDCKDDDHDSSCDDYNDNSGD